MQATSATLDHTTVGSADAVTVSESGIEATGIITATTFNGSLAASNLTGALPAIDGSALTGIGTENIRTGILDVAGIATFRSDTLVGSGITLSPDGDVSLTGVITATTEFHGNGSNLNSLPAGQLSGSLPAINGSALLGIARTDNIRTNTNATFLQNVNVSGSTTTGSVLVGSGW